MRLFKLASVVLALFFLPQAGAHAAVVAKVDISSQTMSVYVNGSLRHQWPVSTARRGYVTPRGVFRPQALRRMHYSHKYHNSPMPHSVFFKGGYAVHGTGSVGQLGRPASHGCVRLAPVHAAQLYSLIQQYGAGSSKIVITN